MTYSKPFISANRIAILLGIHHVTACACLATFGVDPVRIGERNLYRTTEILPLLNGLLQPVG